MITSISYANKEQTILQAVFDNGQVWSIPYPDIGDGPSREAVQKYIDAGNTIADYVAPPLPDVTTITKLQFVEWCEANDKLTALLGLLDSDAILKFKWDAATALEISNPLVLGAAQALQLDAQAVFNEIGGLSA